MLSGAYTWSLTGIAAVTGVALLWTWKRFSNQARVTQAKRQMRARLYAMRLFADDPALVLRAQRQLLLWIGRYLGQVWRPAAVALVPLLFLFVQLDGVYGHRPLAVGETAIVTAHFGAGAGLRATDATLEGRGLVVETAGVRIPGRREMCWRVRAGSAASGSVILHVGGTTISRSVICGHGLPVFPDRWSESPSIEVPCPAAKLDVFGFGIGWEIWFPIVSTITMWASGGAGLETRRRPGGLPHL